MQVIETAIPEVILFQPRKFDDPRGYFFESFSARFFKELGIDADFVQEITPNTVIPMRKKENNFRKP
jgi:dTDP-4-dehydrorhamnose 3,5-epimerase